MQLLWKGNTTPTELHLCPFLGWKDGQGQSDSDHQLSVCHPATASALGLAQVNFKLKILIDTAQMAPFIYFITA